MKKKGFTLVELLVVIAILAILATVSIVGYTQFIDKAKKNVALQECTQVRDLAIAADINDTTFDLSDGVERVKEVAYSAATYKKAASDATWAEDTYFTDDKGTAVEDEDAFNGVENKTNLYIVDKAEVKAVTPVDELAKIQSALLTDANGLAAKLSYVDDTYKKHETLKFTASNGKTCTWNVIDGTITED